MYPIDEESLGEDISQQEHMKEISTTLTPTISDSFDAVEGFQAITIHAPVIIDEEYDGTVAYLINLNKITELFLEDTDKLYKEIYLVDSNNIIIYSNKKEKTGQHISNYLNYEYEYENQEVEEKIVEDEKIVIVKEFYITNKEWKLINVEYKENMLKDINKYINFQKIFVTISITLILILGIILNFLLTKHLRREIAENTKELSEKVEKEEKTKKAIIHILTDFKNLNKKTGKRE
jgi:hypothetical protein